MTHLTHRKHEDRCTLKKLCGTRTWILKVKPLGKPERAIRDTRIILFMIQLLNKRRETCCCLKVCLMMILWREIVCVVKRPFRINVLLVPFSTVPCHHHMPMILDSVIGSSGEVPRNHGPSVTMNPVRS